MRSRRRWSAPRSCNTANRRPERARPVSFRRGSASSLTMARTSSDTTIGATPMQRSRATLGEVYAAHADSAKRLAYLLTGDRELAEDITQDAFVKLAGRLGGIRDRNA